MYGLPIKNIEFHQTMDMVYSMDSSVVKIWERNNVNKIYEPIDGRGSYSLNTCEIIFFTG